MRAPDVLLYDSEASLRLIDRAIEELRESGAEPDGDAAAVVEHAAPEPSGFAELSRTLLRAYAETIGLVARMQNSAGLIDRDGVERLHEMHQEVRKVSTATELATSQILDAVGRCITLVDRISASGSTDGVASCDPGQAVENTSDRQAAADELFAIQARRTA
jgi:hypothetical protein